MIFDKLPDLVVDKSLVQSASGRQQIRDCCHAAEADLRQGPTIRMFACDAGNDILLLLSALDYIERIEGDHKAIDALLAIANGLLPDVETALLANGGEKFREDWCECDPDVGASPCRYCAVDSALRRTKQLLLKMNCCSR